MNRSLQAVGLAIVIGCFNGCGSGESLPLVPTTGQVLYQGVPVADASVMLVPQDGQRAAVGATNEVGQFTLGTLSPADGAMPGKYKILVSKIPSIEPAADAMDMPDVTKENNRSLPKSRPSELPAKYSQPSGTPLTCEIPSGVSSHDLGTLELTK
ncbi:MAG: hypothetical protein KatS3mg111_2925 [Pirellulaceae bacterium]|nr:MAG: hypothetical protein KatS3mg111_2925 [Pirellulaceae bacterium]